MITTINEFRKFINELNIDTYAKQLDSTENFPMTSFVSGNYDKRALGTRKGRVNDLSKTRFIQEFMKKYPTGLKIQTSAGELIFDTIKFRSNFTNYDLLFTDARNNNFTATYSASSPDKIYFLNNPNMTVNPESVATVKDMLKFNLQARTHGI